MFPKKQRISKTKEIDAVFKGKISVFNNNFGLKAIPNDLGYNRYTVIISTKVSKLAVERNRIKRAVKNYLKRRDQDIKKPHDFVIICLKNAQNQKSSEIEKSIENLIKRSRLI